MKGPINAKQLDAFLHFGLKCSLIKFTAIIHYDIYNQNNVISVTKKKVAGIAVYCVKTGRLSSDFIVLAV